MYKIFEEKTKGFLEHLKKGYLIMKKIFALPLTLSMIFSTVSPVLAAEPSEEPAGGCVIEEVTEENLTGEYSAAYEAAGYQATFTYVAGEDEDIAKIEVLGDFQWVTDELAEEFIASDYSSQIRILSAYEYVDGAFHTGYSNPGGAGEYPEGICYDGGFLNYTMTEVADDVYQITMPMPAGFYRYEYRITDSKGESVLVDDPCNDFGYTIEENNPTPADWSLILVGTADEVSETEAYAYPIEDTSKQGTVEKAVIKTYLGTDQGIAVYLPYDYDENDTEPYKTLYVAHGSTENEDTWMVAGALPNMMDRLIAEGRIDHTIVVTMDNCVPLNNYADDVPRNFVECLIPYIEENYNVSTDPENRAICGSSRGGQMVYDMMSDYPDLMKYYGAFSFRREVDMEALFPAETVEALKDSYICLGRGNVEPATPAMLTKYNDLIELGLENVVLYDSIGAHDWRNWRSIYEQYVDYLGW